MPSQFSIRTMAVQIRPLPPNEFMTDQEYEEIIRAVVKALSAADNAGLNVQTIASTAVSRLDRKEHLQKPFRQEGI